MNKFRTLRPDEIECRVGRVKPPDNNGPGGVSLLLYKTARTDANLLDETVGPENWENDFKLIDGVLYGGIGIFDAPMDRWVWKWDAGVESNTEAEKGRASDAFKRAGYKHGIGRELYTSPFIWVSGNDCRIKERKCLDSFTVTDIEYDNAGTIVGLALINDKTRKSAYSYGTCRDTGSRRESAQRPQEAAPAPQTAPDGNFYCLDCGQQILPITGPDGKEYGPVRVMNRALKKYHCQLCWDCQLKRDESQTV